MKSTHKMMLARLLPVLAFTALALPPAAADSAGTGMEATVMQDFRAADTDRDGYLSSQEGRDYVGTSLHLDDLAFRAADTNGDGRLSPEEFTNHVKASRAKPEVPAKPMPYSY